jgi:HSP20 family protein
MEVTAPAVDLYEEKDDIVVKAELPGMDKDNIEVNLTDHRLTIKGERKRGRDQRRELLQVGTLLWLLVRTLELPTDVHTDKVKAGFKNGILEVRLPKTEEAKAKEVKVKVD